MAVFILIFFQGVILPSKLSVFIGQIFGYRRVVFPSKLIILFSVYMVLYF